MSWIAEGSAMHTHQHRPFSKPAAAAATTTTTTERPAMLQGSAYGRFIPQQQQQPLSDPIVADDVDILNMLNSTTSGVSSSSAQNVFNCGVFSSPPPLRQKKIQEHNIQQQRKSGVHKTELCCMSQQSHSPDLLSPTTSFVYVDDDRGGDCSSSSGPPHNTTSSLSIDVWSVVFGFLPLIDILPFESFFVWCKAETSIQVSNPSKLLPARGRSLHVVSRFFQQRVLHTVLHRCTSTSLCSEMQPTLLFLLNRMTVLPELQSLHIRAVITAHARIDYMNIKPSTTDNMATPYCKKYILYQLILRKLQPLRSFAIRDIRNIFPDISCNTIIFYELVLRAIMSLKETEEETAADDIFFGVVAKRTILHSPDSSESVRQCAKNKKWHCLNFASKGNCKDSVPPETRIMLVNVVLMARYSKVVIDDSLGADMIETLGVRILSHCYTNHHLFRPMTLLILRDAIPQSVFLIEVLAVVIEKRMYTHILVQTTRVSLQPLLNVIYQSYHYPCWSQCRLNGVRYNQVDELPIPDTSVNHIEVVNAHIALRLHSKNDSHVSALGDT
jgi:hypothetical protein